MLGILDRPQTLLGSWQACLFSWPVPGLPLLFLWASESNVRHCGPPPNPSRQLAGQPATLGILDRPQILLGSWQACLFSSYGLPKATLGIVDRPQTPLGSWQACLFSWPVPGLPLLSYGLPKATLGIVDRPKRVVTRYAAMSCSFFGAQHAIGCLVDCACFLFRPRGEAKTPAAAPQATIIKHSEMAKHRSVLPQQSPDDSKSCNRATTRQKGACGASRAFASTPYLRARLCFLGNPETMLRPTSPAPANQQNGRKMFDGQKIRHAISETSETQGSGFLRPQKISNEATRQGNPKIP